MLQNTHVSSNCKHQTQKLKIIKNFELFTSTVFIMIRVANMLNRCGSPAINLLYNK